MRHLAQGHSKWKHYFEEGDQSREEELRGNRPRPTKYRDAIRTLLDENSYLSEKQIASILNIHQMRVTNFCIKVSCSEK
jgi:hypothetical protein